MTKILTRFAAITILSLAALCAQGPRNDHGGAPGGAGFGGFGGVSSTTTAAQVTTIVTREVTVLTSLLTLTTAQQTQATTIFTNELNAIIALDVQIATAQTALGNAVKANDATGMKTQSAAIGTAQGSIILQEAQADAAFYALLTGAQQTTLNTTDADFFTDLRLPGGGH